MSAKRVKVTKDDGSFVVVSMTEELADKVVSTTKNASYTTKSFWRRFINNAFRQRIVYPPNPFNRARRREMVRNRNKKVSR